jgi:hypothetical protein
MNHKFDQFLTISALTGWVASIAALLTIGINTGRPLTSLISTVSPQAPLNQSSIRPRPNQLPLAVASVGLGLTVEVAEPYWASVTGSHWLDRDTPSVPDLNLIEVDPLSPRPLWQRYAD